MSVYSSHHYAWPLSCSNLTCLRNFVQASENGAEPLPTGELVFTPPTGFQKLLTSARLARALPWRRFKKGSVLVIEVSCQIVLECIERPNACHQHHWSPLRCFSLLQLNVLLTPRICHVFSGQASMFIFLVLRGGVGYSWGVESQRRGRGDLRVQIQCRRSPGH